MDRERDWWERPGELTALQDGAKAYYLKAALASRQQQDHESGSDVSRVASPTQQGITAGGCLRKESCKSGSRVASGPLSPQQQDMGESDSSEQDARRYRWLRKHRGDCVGTDDCKEFDAEIDRAMAQELPR